MLSSWKPKNLSARGLQTPFFYEPPSAWIHRLIGAMNVRDCSDLLIKQSLTCEQKQFFLELVRKEILSVKKTKVVNLRSHSGTNPVSQTLSLSKECIVQIVPNCFTNSVHAASAKLSPDRRAIPPKALPNLSRDKNAHLAITHNAHKSPLTIQTCRCRELTIQTCRCRERCFGTSRGCSVTATQPTIEHLRHCGVIVW